MTKRRYSIRLKRLKLQHNLHSPMSCGKVTIIGYIREQDKALTWFEGISTPQFTDSPLA